VSRDFASDSSEEQAAIRTASAHDLPALHALVERAYRGESARRGWTHEADLLEGARIPAADLAASLADPRQRTLVAEMDGALLGCVQVTDKGGGTAYLGLLSVDPERQAGGLGRKLVAAAEAEAVRAFGAVRMRMTVIRQRPELVAWYERQGYRRTGEEQPFPTGDVRFGAPRVEGLAFVVLEKALPPAP
jgi:ribosomal protein S18 acetylase RimI-like enzyme